MIMCSTVGIFSIFIACYHYTVVVISLSLPPSLSLCVYVCGRNGKIIINSKQKTEYELYVNVNAKSLLRIKSSHVTVYFTCPRGYTTMLILHLYFESLSLPVFLEEKSTLFQYHVQLVQHGPFI